MSTLAALRAALKADLEATALPTFEHLPDRLNPPALLLEPSDPYLMDASEKYGYACFEVSYAIFVVGRRGTSSVQTSALDEHIQAVLAAVANSSTWDLGDVAQPYALQWADAAYLATRITVTTPFRL